MNQLEFQRNHLQMDYYSESYQDFERDFYRYSNMNIPLTFLTDDILKTMAISSKNYFVLNKEKSRDNRDHFFIFEVSTVDENPLIYRYSYKKTTLSSYFHLHYIMFCLFNLAQPNFIKGFGALPQVLKSIT